MNRLAGAPAATATSVAEISSDAQWLQPLRDWPGVALQLVQREHAVVRIVMATVQGSAPREAGVCMLVSPTQIRGTVGGGQLEWRALKTARALLHDEQSRASAHRIVLGGDVGQCCGGVVQLWIERYTREDTELLRSAREAALRGPAIMRSELAANGLDRRVLCDHGFSAEVDLMLRAARERAAPRMRRSASGTELLERLDDAMLPVWLYGAGHVGQALARILLQLPLRLTWIDSRADLLPARPPDSVQVVHSLEPVSTVAAAPSGVRFVLMTHSHSLDYSLCRAILTRADFAWVGLIGSHSKAARFRSRLARHGVGSQLIARLVCPIGVQGINSKWPAAIAVGVAAQLLQGINAHAAQSGLDASTSELADAARSCGAHRCEDCHWNTDK